MKKVSIIVPIFNAEKYLSPSIESVLNQDYKNFQLILVDDGSTDGSAEICHGYSDPRVIYIGKRNGGVSSARNEGMKYLSGGGILRSWMRTIISPIMPFLHLSVP